MRMVIAAALLLGACRSDNGIKVFAPENTPPEAHLSYPTAELLFDEGDALTLLGTATDLDEDDATPLLATWYLGDEIACAASAPAADGATSCAVTLPGGEVSITLEVQDPELATGSDTVGLAVTPNEAPTATITAPDGIGPYYSDQLVALAGVGSDAEDDEERLGVSWESSLDGALPITPQPDSAGVFSDGATLSEGEHVLTLRVTDTNGKSGTDTAVITVGPPNSPPDCAVIAPLDGETAAHEDEVLLLGVVEDADIAATDLTVTWSSDLDGLLGAVLPTDEGEVTLATSALSVGTHVLSLTATDEVGASCVQDVSFTVLDRPEIDFLTPDEGAVLNEGEETPLQVQVSDTEDVPTRLTLAWESDVDGVLGASAADSAGLSTLVAEGLSIGSHVITVTVTDSDGLSASASRLLRVNDLPSAPTIALSPTDPRTADDLLASVLVDSADEEGDAISYAYAWRVDGRDSDASSADTLPASATARGQTWTVTVTPSDPWGEGEPGSASVVIGNTPPSAPVVTIAPSAPIERVHDLVCVVETESVDEDGDEVSYSWTWSVDGASAGISEDTVPAEELVADQTWTCTVTPSDDAAAGEAATDSVSIDCYPGLSEDCPARSCQWLLDGGFSVGDGAYWLDPGLDGVAFETWCDMTTDDGGWTLIAVSADDGASTWTWEDRHLLDTDTTVFGSVDDLEADFKSPALHELAFSDLLFAHSSGDWASYHDVGDGSTDFGHLLTDVGEVCADEADGWPMADGTLHVENALCSTDLYLNPLDREGHSGGSCKAGSPDNHTWGPAWSADNGAGCPFDDVGTVSSFGPDAAAASEERGGRGFGAALGLRGAGGSTDAIWMYVR